MIPALSKYGNLILIGGVGAVLAMMLVPLPPTLLDLLLAINIMAALTLLLVSISVGHSLQLASFPTLLLMATLFRLGLNISSTRLILTNGFAGNIIETFGRFVTGGHLLVGLIMFVILTIVQFLVIAKGSERVAEVAARFTLDALPGKQMSIDADLRAGLIHQEEAKRQREDIQKESRMYGAMDGAMKFVKGDAIAGILITLVNMGGGLLSGVALRGLSLSQAAQNYSTLAVGDGLVSQIPALLVSITAGFIVTRVSETNGKNSLGKDIGLQIFSQPKALLTAAGLAFFIGLTPGLPLWLFLGLALVLSGAGIFLIFKQDQERKTPPSVESYLLDAEQQMVEHVGQAVPLLLEVGPELYRIFKEDPRWVDCFSRMYPRLQVHLTNQMGILFPDLKIILNQRMKESYAYQIRIYDVPVDHGEVYPHHCSLISRSGPSQATLVPPEKSTETVHGTPIQLYQLKQGPELKGHGIKTLGPEEMLLRHLARILKSHAGDFIGIQEVHLLLSGVERHYPELVKEVCPKMMSIQKMTEVVKRLVEEEVPIKDFRLILQTLSTANPEEKDPVTLTEQVRVGLKRSITFKYVSGANRLNAYTLDPQIEDEIKKGIRRNGNECFLVLPPSQIRFLAESFRNGILRGAKASGPKVIVTQLELRRYVRKIIEQDLPQIPVLSFQELDSKVMLNPLGCIAHPLEAQTVVVAN